MKRQKSAGVPLRCSACPGGVRLTYDMETRRLFCPACGPKPKAVPVPIAENADFARQLSRVDDPAKNAVVDLEDRSK